MDKTKRRAAALLLACLAALTAVLWRAGSRQVYTENGVTLDAGRLSEGYVTLSAESDRRLKARLTRAGEVYTYDLPGDGAPVRLPLSQGPGTYTAEVYENTQGNRYRLLFRRELQAGFAPRAPFLHPNQMVNYTRRSAAAQKARELTAGLAGDVARIDAVLTYVAGALRYDQALAATVESGYLPDPDAALARGRGICQDYAALTAAMLRSVGIPCRMEEGTVGDGGLRHAWVRAWSEEAGELSWGLRVGAGEYTLLDPTFLSAGGGSPELADYMADPANYHVQYAY